MVPRHRVGAGRRFFIERAVENDVRLAVDDGRERDLSDMSFQIDTAGVDGVGDVDFVVPRPALADFVDGQRRRRGKKPGRAGEKGGENESFRAD
jgi:hypothetical protein